MPRRSLLHVHSILLQMVKQDFCMPSHSTTTTSKRGKNHIWEVRHAGLLGIKYEVAVRSDLFSVDFEQDAESKAEDTGKEALREVVDVAILGWAGFILLKNLMSETYSCGSCTVLETPTMTSVLWLLPACYLLLASSFNAYQSLLVTSYVFYGAVSLP